MRQPASPECPGRPERTVTGRSSAAEGRFPPPFQARRAGLRYMDHADDRLARSERSQGALVSLSPGHDPLRRTPEGITILCSAVNRLRCNHRSPCMQHWGGSWFQTPGTRWSVSAPWDRTALGIAPDQRGIRGHHTQGMIADARGDRHVLRSAAAASVTGAGVRLHPSAADSHRTAPPTLTQDFPGLGGAGRDLLSKATQRE